MNKKILNYLRDSKREKVLYLFGWIFLILFFTFWQLNKFFPKNYSNICVWRFLFGIYCPGCGGTRAFYFLLKGKLWESIYYHPFVPYTALIGSWFMISHTLSYLTKDKIKGIKFRNIYIYLAIGILIAQFIIKNLILKIGGISII